MLRRCSHLMAFEVTTKVLNTTRSGLPPWMIVCEDCASTIFDALETRLKQCGGSGKSGKSSAAVNFARIRRLLLWLKDNP